jgi:hypothetical protein
MNKLILICIVGIVCISCQGECLRMCGKNQHSCYVLSGADKTKCIDAYVKCCEVCK